MLGSIAKTVIHADGHSIRTDGMYVQKPDPTENKAHRAVGLPVSLGILVIYLQKLYVHHLPESDMIVSSFIPLGPCGLGGFSLLKLGKVSLALLPKAVPDKLTEISILATGLYGAGCVSAITLWALGVS